MQQNRVPQELKLLYRNYIKLKKLSFFHLLSKIKHNFNYITTSYSYNMSLNISVNLSLEIIVILSYVYVLSIMFKYFHNWQNVLKRKCYKSDVEFEKHFSFH